MMVIGNHKPQKNFRIFEKKLTLIPPATKDRYLYYLKQLKS